MKKSTIITALSYIQFAISLSFSLIGIIEGDNELSSRGTMCFCSSCITYAIAALIDKEDK